MLRTTDLLEAFEWCSGHTKQAVERAIKKRGWAEVGGTSGPDFRRHSEEWLANSSKTAAYVYTYWLLAERRRSKLLHLFSRLRQEAGGPFSDPVWLSQALEGKVQPAAAQRDIFERIRTLWLELAPAAVQI